jgi:hypothetical protein
MKFPLFTYITICEVPSVTLVGLMYLGVFQAKISLFTVLGKPRTPYFLIPDVFGGHNIGVPHDEFSDP